jgi:hypothetical protein
MTEDPQAFLHLINKLELAVGKLGYYSSLDPFPCSTLVEGKPAIIEIQRAGKKLAEHAGLGDLTFIIAVASQKPQTAGHIELRHGEPEVYIEISLDICGYKDAVLATLSHEIAHKFLHRMGVDKGLDGLELEFLTDVAAVYLGMGKIMLNGCECHSSRTSTNLGRTATTTHTLKTGYVSQACFAFIYRVICEMRRVPKAKMIEGLGSQGRKALSDCEASYSDWFQPRYREPEGINSAAAELGSDIADTQGRVAYKDHSLRRAVRHIESLRGSLNAIHASLSGARAKVAWLNQADNDRLRYLSFMETHLRVKESIRESEAKLAALDPQWEHVDELSSPQMDGEQPQHVTIECPIDGTRLRLPFGKKRLLVTCSSCKYAFIVTTADTEKTSFSEKVRARVGSVFQRK